MPVAERLIVLTFDDGVKSQVSFVAPLLKKPGFGATFYITDDERFHGERYLTWEEAKELNDDAFEIGNHLGAHTDVTRLSAEEFARQVEQVERRCEAYGIERPVTFCYPGYHNNREAVEVLAEKGYIFARRGVAPEYPQTDEGDRGPAYIPGEDHPLLVPTTGASGPRWGFEDLVWASGQAKDGAIPVLTFHGVPDVEHPWVNTDPDDFQRYMEYLKDGGYTVVALRDLREWVDLSRQPDDPYVPINRRLMR